MRRFVGTSGYSYDEWKGPFYPEDLPAKKMLAFYAERLDTVEINNTFYRMPKREVVRAWAEQVPEGFSFVLKAPQRITHKKRLDGVEEDLAYFAEASSELGAKQGPTLFQLPPYFRKDLARLRAFLALLPDGWRAAFEFRHASWFDEEVYGALRERGAALVVSDQDDAPAPPVVATASWGYLRLRRTTYDGAALSAWAQRVSEQPWQGVWVFFKHEDAGAGPKLAAAFRAIS
jgi:uncharacterized protein YecE (DUF72 family)